MREVIWVMGPSAVGKETFIKTIAGDHRTLELMGLENKSIVSCGASYHFNGAYKGDAVDAAREKIFDEIPELLNKYDVVFIKWQHVDSELHRPERLQKLIPDAVHRALLLVAPRKELAERLLKKSWWHDRGNENMHVNAGIKNIKVSVNSLPGSIQITMMSSSKQKPYSLIADKRSIDLLY